MSDSETGESGETGETAGTAPEPQRPFLQVVSPDATPEEIAALVAVLGALGGGEEPAPRRVPQWSRPTRLHRPPVAHGPGGWRASGLPR